MSLFDRSRDMDLFRKLNMELINKVINTEVKVFQLDPTNMTSNNTYGETTNKMYYEPFLINCLVDRTDPMFESANTGFNYNQGISFSFLYDELENFNYQPFTGDILEWDNDFFELSEIFQNEYFAGKNPTTSYNGTEHGYNVSIKCRGYKIKDTSLPMTQRVLR